LGTLVGWVVNRLCKRTVKVAIGYISHKTVRDLSASFKRGPIASLEAGLIRVSERTKELYIREVRSEKKKDENRRYFFPPSPSCRFQAS